ncbi:cation:dicarboxylate symporter family transporter [Streptomyces tremellae]|uniref:C4-dicarboxylate transporter DctC n=1 Tax=Streptomyces tremellae TaxID=1124239 RepID=A0ABP7FYP8_9ACTN
MPTHPALPPAATGGPAPRSAWYRGLGFQVLAAMVLGVAVGLAFPGLATDLKVVGDLFLSLIKAGVAPLVFFTIVLGITSAGDLRKASRIGLLALLYFEVVSTVALLLGLLAANLLGVGRGAGPLPGDKADVPDTSAQEHGLVAFLQGIVPDNVVGAFTSGQLLQVVVIAVIFGVGLLTLPQHLQTRVHTGMETISECFFAFVNVVMRLAPVGAFGAIAYSVGSSGTGLLLALGELVLEYWVVIAVFVFGVLGPICLLAGFNIWRIMRCLRVEIALTLSTASSESALPGILKKLPRMGASQQTVGLVVPTGYAFNLDGTSVYLSLCTLFLANVYGIHLGLSEQLGLLVIMLLTSKGAATVAGGTFVVFASTVAATDTLPLSGVAVLFGVYRIMAMATSTVNSFGNAVATLVLAKWTHELDEDKARRALADPAAFLAAVEQERRGERSPEAATGPAEPDAAAHAPTPSQ